MTNTDLERIKRLALAVLETEANAISDLASEINDRFVEACRLMLECKGRIVVLGMGKSGHIGNKIAATLASTGTPAFFVHPGEASHGDLGMITPSDVVLALSNSGETREILDIVPIIKRLGIPLISLSGNHDSTLAQQANVSINVGVKKEACPLGLAPTASTTATLAMGDALAVALLESRGFTEEDFARSHPGGSLGKRLLLLISDIMHTGDAIPSVPPKTLLKDAVVEMTNKGLGMTTITDSNRHVLGLLTDGDLRRIFDQPLNIHETEVEQVMTPGSISIRDHLLAAEGLQLMQAKRINGLLVVNSDNELVGVLNMHDMLRAGII